MSNPGREPRRRATPGLSVLPVVVSVGTMIIALALLVAPISSATSARGRPLGVQSTSVPQNGQQLVWQLKMAYRGTPGALARDRRTLCLVFARADSCPV